MSLKRKAGVAPAIKPSASDLGHPTFSSSSSSFNPKRVRIQSDAHDQHKHQGQGDDDDDEGTEIIGDLDLEEQERKRNQPGRKGRIVTTGYDSDDDQEQEEQRQRQRKAKARARAKQRDQDGDDDEEDEDEDEDDDMFDLDDDKGKEKKAKKHQQDDEEDQDEKREARTLDLSEIDGQEFGQVTRIPGDELEQDLKQQLQEEEEMDPELELEKDSDDDDDEDEDDPDEQDSDDENARGERTPSPIGENPDDKKARKKLKKKKGMGFKLDSFNMKNEYQTGRFDEDGNYLEKSKDPNAQHDSWLKGNYSRKKLRKAKEANEKKIQMEEERLRKLDEEFGDENNCRKGLVEFMMKGESVLEALQRVGNQAKKIKDERKKNLKKKGYGKSSRNPEASGEGKDTIMKDPDSNLASSDSKPNPNSSSTTTSTDAEEEHPSIKALERITSLSSTLMSRFGLLNIYQETYESLLRSVRRSGIVPQDWEPPTTSSQKEDLDSNLTNQDQVMSSFPDPDPNSNLTSSSTSTSTSTSTSKTDSWQRFQYRWSPSYLSQVAKSQNTTVSPEIEIFGPFEIQQLKEWASSGFFGGEDRERILLRDAEHGGEWKRWNQVVP